MIRKQFIYILSCFVKSGLVFHRIETLVLIVYSGFYYKLQTISINNKELGKLLFFSTQLIYVINSSITSILSMQIRNTAGNLIRKDYLKDVFQNKPPEYKKENYGIIFSKTKRIQNLVAGLDRELMSCITSFPILITCCIKIFYLQNMYIYLMVGLNLAIALFTVNKIISKRISAFKTEDELGKEIIGSFSSHSLMLKIDKKFTDLQNIFNKEILSYSNAINYKNIYKIIIYLPNIIAIYFFIAYGILKDADIICTFLFALHWGKITSSIASGISMIYGIDVISSNHEDNKVSSQANIKIQNLTIDGVFDDESLMIRSGSKLVIFGENGVGKTLLGRIICGYEKKVLGTISVPSKSIMLGSENILSQADKEIILTQYDLQSKYRDLLSKDFLSKGQTNFFITLLSILHIPNVELIVLDETIDSIASDFVQDIIKIIKSSEKTIIIITHRKDVIESFDLKINIKDREINWIN